MAKELKELKDTSILMMGFDPNLLKKGIEVDAVARHQKYASGLKRLDIIVFTRSKIKQNDIADNCRIYNVGHGPAAIDRALWLAKKLFRRHHYDIIDMQDPHVAGWVGYQLKKAYGRKYKTKLEVHFHGDFWNNKFWVKESWKNRIYNKLQKKITKKADAIRVVNPLIKEKLVKSGISAKKIAIINTPVNEAAFVSGVVPEKIQAIHLMYGQKKILLFVGRFVKAKNLLFLIKIISQLKKQRDDFVLLMIGQGDLQDTLTTAIKANGLEKTAFIIKPQSHLRLVAYYQAAYLNLLLSTNESFGKVIVEAGMAKTPSLASKTLGASAIIEDKHNGWLVDINDQNKTLEKLNYILDHEDEAKRLGDNAYEIFLEKYGQQKAFARVNEFWYKIINDLL
jgi:glycosyltransferase involved in cell wall biosynthesis